ncbi:MAG TPA: DUF3592 domain-containing protein, partial [Gammaproteobacteria bacterium]|nr:DUF3592 domain-containing protein [Gammaproteobacteria bacterium]
MKLSLTGATFALWFGGVWLVVGVPFLVLGLYVGIDQHFASERMKAEGVVATGMVLTKRIDVHDSHGSGSTSNASSPSYSTSFRFVTERGETVKGEAQVDKRTWSGLVERGPVTVTYLPDAPSRYRIDGQDDRSGAAFIFAVLGAAFASAGGIVFGRGLVHSRVESRLRREGARAEAVVERVGPSRITINGVPQLVVRYRYRDASGRSRAGKSDPMPPREAAAWKAGDRARIRYDPQLPQRSLWLGRD